MSNEPDFLLTKNVSGLTVEVLTPKGADACKRWSMKVGSIRTLEGKGMRMHRFMKWVIKSGCTIKRINLTKGKRL